MTIAVKRIYEDSSPDDGVRVLVDRLWPRGVSKGAAQLDRWMKDIAPSEELRRWFNHDPAKWDECKRRYHAELADKSELVDELRTLAKKQHVTLLYAARDEQHNNAVALREFLVGTRTG